MTLQNSNLKLRPSVLISDTVPAQNGGRMAYSEVVSGVKNNLLPDATAAQRLNGLVRWRKVFWHVDSADTVALNNVMVYMDKKTPGDDYLLIQGDNVTATGTEDSDKDEPLLYGIGMMDSDVNAGQEWVEIVYEHVDYDVLLPFRVGMMIRISNIPPAGGPGTEEFVTLTDVASSGVRVAVLTFTGSPLANSYLMADTLVSGVISGGTVKGYGWSTGSSIQEDGVLDLDTPGNLQVPSNNSIEESWTLTFTSADTFTVAGVTVGALPGTGSISADYSALDPESGVVLFTLLSSAWSGVFTGGDFVSFDTVQASLPLLIRQCIPAGSGSLAGNVGAIAIRGESA